MSKEEQPDKSRFDPATATELQGAASKKLSALLKAKQKATDAASSKEFAVRCVRGLESTIHQLFDVGTNTQEVLSQLIEALPSIPVDDLRYALRAIGARKQLRVASQPSAPPTNAKPADKKTAPQTPSATPKEIKPEPQPRTTTRVAPVSGATSDLPAWADGSDKRADESDDDYRLRKEIEGPPEARHKFIGEQDA